MLAGQLIIRLWVIEDIGDWAAGGARVGQAIELHLAGLREDGQPIPPPSTVAATVITLDAA